MDRVAIIDFGVTDFIHAEIQINGRYERPFTVSSRAFANDAHRFSTQVKHERKKHVAGGRIPEILAGYNGRRKGHRLGPLRRFLVYSRRHHDELRGFYGSKRERRLRLERVIYKMKTVSAVGNALLRRLRGDTLEQVVIIFGDAKFRSRSYWPRGRQKKHHPKPPYKHIIHFLRSCLNVFIKVVPEKFTSTFCHRCKR
jgi:hypothetical protein